LASACPPRRARNRRVNGTQATTYTLTTPANTLTFTFGPNANITAAPGTPGVTGDTLTNWSVINQGQITGGGGLCAGIYLNTPGGNSVTNSGSITNGVSLRGNGNSSLANLAGGTITGNAVVNSGTMTNAGTITGNANGGNFTLTNSGNITGNVRGGGNLTLTNSGNIGGYVYINSTGIVTNQAGGTITGGVVLSTNVNAAPGTLTNAGAIGSSAASSNHAVGFNGVVTLTNQSGGTLTGVTDGVYLLRGGTVTNQPGGTITGGTNGVHARSGSATVTNAGAITGTAGNGIFLQQGDGSVANQAGGTIRGGVDGVKIYGGGGGGVGTVTNAGSITGTGGTGVSIGSGASPITTASLTNLRGGTITGTTGVYAFGTNTTVTNAGTITGTGGTAISLFGNSTTLILQTGSVINGDAVALSDNGRLILQGTGTANNLFQFFFFGLDVQASGVWALNNVNTFPAVSIESGALVIGDASHPGAQLNTVNVTVQSGGTLGGQGTVDVGGGSGTIFAANGGTIAPGVASPFTTLNVNGNVQFNTGSFFNVNVNGAGQTDKLALSGTATLVGGTVQVQPAATNYAGSTNYTILTAGTRNSTTFAGVTAQNIFLSPSLSYPSQQQVVLTLTAKPFNMAASTPNQTAVANALNAGAQNTLTALLFGQTSIAGAQRIFDALSGEIFASVQNTQAEETQFARNAMLGRMRQTDAEGDTAALGFGGPMAFADSLYNNLPAPIASANASANGRTASSPRELTSWLQGFGGFGKADGNSNAASLSTTYTGFLTGADIRYGMLRAGLMGGYSHANLNVDARGSSGGIDSAHLGAYGSLAVGGFHLRSGAAASFDTVDTSRSIAVPGFADRTRGRFNGYTAQIFSEVAYSMTTGRVALEPYAGLAYVRVHDAAFLESGGLAALSSSANNMNIGYSSLGLRAATQWTLANGTIVVPHASAAWQYAFGDVVPTAALAFASTGAAFTVAGVPIAKNSALVEGGIDWRITAQMKFGVAYQGELAKSAQTNTAKGSFTWNF
jgi:outer membrane autotransporter protein